MNFKTAVVQIVVVSLLIFANFALVTAQSDSIYRLPVGTRIRLKMDVELSSRVANVNDTFTATVAKAVMVRDTVILPVGTIVEGRVDSVTMAASGGHNGELDPIFESIRVAKSSSQKIDAVLVNKLTPPSSMTGVMSLIGGTVIGAVIGAASKTNNGALIGAGVGAGAGTAVALMRKGKDVRIRTGEEFDIELKHELVLPVLDY